MKLLSGKSAVITGARRGMGKAVVEAFSQEGANVWACARSQDDVFIDFCERLAAHSDGFVRPVFFDLDKSDQIKAAVKIIRSERIPVTALINCAGVTAPSSSFSMTSSEVMAHVYSINVIRQMELTQYLLRAMTNGASIVNVSSIAASSGLAGQYAYSCSKAAVEVWTKMLAAEMAPKGIRVNAIAPGFIETDMGYQVSDDLLNRFLDSTSMKRMAKPCEIADVIAYLASDRSSYINGQVIGLSGGGALLNG